MSAAAVLLLTIGTAAAQQAPTAERIQELVQAAGADYGVKGLAVAVVQDGGIIAEVGYGEASAGKPMTPKTLTNIASCSKAFTATAVAMCVEEKLLAWDDLVIDHLPEFRMSDPWITAHMTIRDLLCHRCGLATFAGDLLWYGSDYSDDEVIRRLAKLPVTQPFRGEFGYQNLMYLVAGKIVERKTGQTWGDFVQKRIMQQLGMNQSRPDAQSVSDVADRALPHIDGEVIPDHEFHACKPAASIYSSAHELSIWMRALMAGGVWKGEEIVSQASLIEMWRPHTHTATGGTSSRTDDFKSYGLGWFLSIDRGNKIVEHDGGMPGFLSKVSMMPGKRFGFVLLNNGNDGIVNEALKRALYAEYAGEDGMKILKRIATIKKRIDADTKKAIAKREGQRREGTSLSHEIKDYVGDYEDDIYGDAKVTLTEGGELSLVLVPAKRRIFGTMKHWHDDTFRVDFPDKFLPFALVSFKLDSQSNIVSFKIDCPIADFDFGALDFRRQE
ncbi:MAG: CubicO group peptidase (beta-lactamase class C family) [Planctomycetota bacterium]|jgi:CubicO group peptidase (beta-lactamase class C family)